MVYVQLVEPLIRMNRLLQTRLIQTSKIFCVYYTGRLIKSLLFCCMHPRPRSPSPSPPTHYRVKRRNKAKRAKEKQVGRHYNTFFVVVSLSLPPCANRPLGHFPRPKRTRLTLLFLTGKRLLTFELYNGIFCMLSVYHLMSHLKM